MTNQKRSKDGKFANQGAVKPSKKLTSMTPTASGPTATINGSNYRVERHPFSYPGGEIVYLIGARGGTYFARPYSGEHTGIFEVVSNKSGQPLRDKYGKAVRVTILGDIIETVKDK